MWIFRARMPGAHRRHRRGSEAAPGRFSRFSVLGFQGFSSSSSRTLVHTSREVPRSFSNLQIPAVNEESLRHTDTNILRHSSLLKRQMKRDEQTSLGVPDSCVRHVVCPAGQPRWLERSHDSAADLVIPRQRFAKPTFRNQKKQQHLDRAPFPLDSRCCGRVGRLEAIDKAGDMKARTHPVASPANQSSCLPA